MLLQTGALSEALVDTMFWKYNTLAVSHIDTLLDKPTVTLAEILEQEDIIQECKSQNKKLDRELRCIETSSCYHI